MKNEIPPEILERLERMRTTLEPTLDEIRRKYGSLLAEWQAERERDRRLPLGEVLFQLWEGIWIQLAEGMLEFRVGLADPATARAFATRDASALAGTEHVFIQKGENCYGRVGVQRSNRTRVHLEFSFRDTEGHPIQHFYLTVARLDGTMLLDRHEVRGQAYAVEHVELADYDFLLESADNTYRVRMGWKVAED